MTTTAPTDQPVPAIPSVAEQSLLPDPLIREFLKTAPVVRIRAPFGGECWLVTRYDDVRAVQADARFSRTAATGADVARTSSYPLAEDSILGMDPPDHSRIRRLVSKEFTARRVERLRPRAQQVVDGLLDSLAAAGPPADLVEGLAHPLPITMICELLGVPYADRDRFRGWSVILMSSGGHTIEEIVAARDSLLGYIDELIAQRRARPSDDLLSGLVAVRDDDDGGSLGEGELRMLAMAMLTGGFETTASQLAKSVFCLLTAPAALAQLRARMDLVPSAVDELLRFIPLSSGTALAYVAVEDVEMGGVVIRAGDAVMASAATANRDERVFNNPDEIDVARTPNPHVAFGHGPHFCVGAHLARMEMQVALGSLLGRFPDLRLAVPAAEVPWREATAVWGLKALPVTF